MPKMKTHSGAKKRFKVTGTGKLRRQQINTNHGMEKRLRDALGSRIYEGTPEVLAIAITESLYETDDF